MNKRYHNRKVLEKISRLNDLLEIVAEYTTYFAEPKGGELLGPYGLYGPKESKKFIATYKEVLQDLLVSRGLNVRDENFFDDTVIELPGTTKLLVKKCKEEKVFEIKENPYNLQTYLENNKKIKERCKDREFAKKLYSALCNVMWVKDDIHWTCSWRCAGDIVAQLRNENEDYMDYYCGGAEGSVFDEVEDLLGEMGWKPKFYED
jgi:hypothetical protein